MAEKYTPSRAWTDEEARKFTAPCADRHQWDAWLAAHDTRVRRDAQADALRDAAEYIDGEEPHHLGDSDLDPLDYNTLGEYGIDRAAEWLRACAADIEKED